MRTRSRVDADVIKTCVPSAIKITPFCEQRHTGRRRTRAHFPAAREVDMLELFAFAVVAVALATPFVVPLIWGRLEQSSQDTAAAAQDELPTGRVGDRTATVCAALIAFSAFMQAADAQPLPNDRERFRMIEECLELTLGRSGGKETSRNLPSLHGQPKHRSAPSVRTKPRLRGRALPADVTRDPGGGCPPVALVGARSSCESPPRLRPRLRPVPSMSTPSPEILGSGCCRRPRRRAACG